MEIPGCPPNEQCPGPMTLTTDYVGNFVYQNGVLEMVYHPEGVIRPTPASAENETEYVYDYFIKDYLGNLRVVLTEENATYESSMVATMEEYRANWEEANFENIEEGREPVPFNYPLDASFPFNQFIAKLVADNEMTIGPAKVLEVNQGDRVKLATQYFYEEDAPGTAYDNLGFLVEEILVSMAAAGAGILPVGEGTLVNLATGSTNLGNHIANFLSNNMDTTDMDRPQAYLVWLAYDKDFKLDPTSSGALRVQDPNELGTLMSGELTVNKPGYLHVYVANGTEAKTINFDNLYITTMQGKTRQINHYYPFGLRMRMGQGQKYKNMYTGKELQTGEYWDASVSTGLEMYDFGSRFYDPAIGRWHTPDPAEQFANPYLAMGNNPVMYVDPNGEIAFLAVVGIFAAVQLGSDLIRNDGKMNIGEIGMSVGLGALQGALAFSGAGGLGAYAGCGAGWLTLGSAVAGQINIPVYQGENFSLSVSPSLATGTNGVRLGANAFASYRNGDFSISGGYSFGRNFSSWDLSEQMAEARWSSISSISAGINGTDGGFNLGLTKFGGNYPSTVGSVGFSKGRFGFSHENDFLAPNNQDRYRTGRLGFSWQATDDLTLTAGFEVLTGNGTSTVPISEGRSQKQYIEDVGLRNGISSFGVQYRGNDYRVGWNSEGARAFMQNGWHDSMHILGMKNSPWFERMNYPPAPYTYFGNTNPFTGYGF